MVIYDSWCLCFTQVHWPVFLKISAMSVFNYSWFSLHVFIDFYVWKFSSFKEFDPDFDSEYSHPPPLACHWRISWQRSNFNSAKENLAQKSSLHFKMDVFLDRTCSGTDINVLNAKPKILWQKDQTYGNFMSFHSISSWPSILIHIEYLLLCFGDGTINPTNNISSQCSAWTTPGLCW